MAIKKGDRVRFVQDYRSNNAVNVKKGTEAQVTFVWEDSCSLEFETSVSKNGLTRLGNVPDRYVKPT